VLLHVVAQLRCEMRQLVEVAECYCTVHVRFFVMRVTQIFLLFFRNSFLFTDILIYRGFVYEWYFN